MDFIAERAENSCQENAPDVKTMRKHRGVKSANVAKAEAIILVPNVSVT